MKKKGKTSEKMGFFPGLGDDTLKKPFDMMELKNKIGRMLIYIRLCKEEALGWLDIGCWTLNIQYTIVNFQCSTRQHEKKKF